jgi:hypothetical protein
MWLGTRRIDVYADDAVRKAHHTIGVVCRQECFGRYNRRTFEACGGWRSAYPPYVSLFPE